MFSSEICKCQRALSNEIGVDFAVLEEEGGRTFTSVDSDGKSATENEFCARKSWLRLRTWMQEEGGIFREVARKIAGMREILWPAKNVLVCY